jgi:hypothetical protein
VSTLASKPRLAPRSRLGDAAAAGAASPFALALVTSFAVAALSAAVLPTVPSYDPWSWIVWGREVFDPHLSFFVGGGPSWKPLPVVFTAVFGPFGAAAPTLWVITARAGGLMALIAAYRLGALLVGRGRDATAAAGASVAHGEPIGASVGRGGPVAGSVAGGEPGGASVSHPEPGASSVARREPVSASVAPWEPVAAGLLTAAGVLLTQDWFYYMFRGTSEPMLVGLSLWAIDRHLAGRHVLAFVLGVAASLIRPEWWPFVFLYGIWLWRREPRPWLAVLILAGWFSIPFFWFVPPWISTGQPLLAATHAQEYNGHLGSDPFLEVLRRGADLQAVPSLVFALVAVAITWWQERDRLILGLAAAAAAWWVLVVAMTLDGYPGLERFYLPAAGIICVLGGVGVVRAARLTADRIGAALGGVASGSRLAWAAAALLVAVSIPFTITRAGAARAARPTAAHAVTRFDQLTAAVAAAGGHDAVFPCKSSFAAANHSAQTALAWKLHVTLERVGTSMHAPGVMFVGPHDSIDGGPPRINHRLNRKQLVASAGAWRVYRLWTAGLPTACVGR